MRRLSSTPRPHWQRRVEEAGLTWHSLAEPDRNEQPYWNETAFYELTAHEVDVLERATNELAAMALKAAGHIVENNLFAKLAIPQHAIPLIQSSWEAEPPSLYGRFDLSWDGLHPPKLLEYNADTPTSLLEASVVQWHWLEDLYPCRDQFNSLHERLIARWKELIPHLPGRRIDLCSVDDAEDRATIAYLLETARQAGLTSSLFRMDEIGWDGQTFLAPDDRPLRAVFKLYPWEWMVHEEFGRHLGVAPTLWIEPAWKMLLSNKGILPVLWRLFPGHPNLVEASFDTPGAMTEWVRKPLLGREGANITLHCPGGDFETAGDYGAEGFVYQALAPAKTFDGKTVVIGSWVVGHGEDCAAGIGIRESDTPVVTNTSQFVPHAFD